MTRLCILGTSHIGALKAGWDDIKAEYKEWEVVFFGAPDYGLTERLRCLKLHGSKLVPTENSTLEYFKITSGGQSEIDLDAFDCFLIQDAGINIGIILHSLYSSFRSERHTLPGGRALVSEACFSDAVKALFLSSVAVRLANDISAAVEKPVHLVPGPCPSQGLLSARKASKKIWRDAISMWQKVHAVNDDAVLATQYQSGLDVLHEQGYRLFDVPAEMHAAPCFTRHEYCDGAEWLQDSKFEFSPDDDYFHMNRRYGAGLLSSFFQSTPL